MCIFVTPLSLNVISNSIPCSPSFLFSIFYYLWNASVAALSVVKPSLHASLCMFFICPVFPSFSYLSFFLPFFLLQCFPFCYQVICCHLFPFYIKLLICLFSLFALCQSSSKTISICKFIWRMLMWNRAWGQRICAHMFWVMCEHCTGTEECYSGGEKLDQGLFLLMGGDLQVTHFFLLSNHWSASPVSQLDEELRQNLKVTMQQKYQQLGEESVTQAVDKLHQEVLEWYWMFKSGRTLTARLTKNTT